MLAEVMRRFFRKAEQFVSLNGQYRARARDGHSHSALSQGTRDVSGMCKIRLAPVPKRTVQPSLCVTIM